VPSDDLAERARTNAYEVMTALGRRYAASMSMIRHLFPTSRAGGHRVTLPIVTALGR